MRRTSLIPLLTILSAVLLLQPLTLASSQPGPQRNDQARNDHANVAAGDRRVRLIGQSPAPEQSVPSEEGSDADVPGPDMDQDSMDQDNTDMDVDAEGPHNDGDHPDIDIDSDDSSRPVREQEKIEKSFSMPSGHRSLEIDNIWGSIEVIGGPSDQVQLTVNKTIRAESKDKLEKARKEVTLDITQQADSLKLYVNGPFRCQCNDCRGSRDDEGHIVTMDFQLRVPPDIDLQLKTVTERPVVIPNANGSYLVRTVTGDIQI